jgi:N-acyl amino acid synthase of PEP-CTERM/exosortase system
MLTNPISSESQPPRQTQETPRPAERVRKGAPYRPIGLDGSKPMLLMSYRLRYQSFCLDRVLFNKEQYPNQLESDAYDPESVHVGVINAKDELVGTARVISLGDAGLPLLRYCTLFPQDTTLVNPSNNVVELSRVCLNSHWDRRTTNRAIPHPDRRAVAPLPVPAPGREARDPFVALIKGVYQATKRLHATHWIVAVEKALRRRLLHYGLPFRLAGPESDYFGPVAPYVLSLAELDQVIETRTFPALNDIRDGLESEYWPSSLRQTSA